MTLTRMAPVLALVGALFPSIAAAQTTPLRIAVLNDVSSVYADDSGLGSVEAARMAIEDAGGSVLGRTVELLNADHQNKADIGTNIARQWYDVDGVRAIFDVNNSSVAIGVSQIAAEKDRLALFVGAASTDLSGKFCTPVSAQFLYDTYSVVRGTVEALTNEGVKSWYFIAADYAFGHSLENEATKLIEAAGNQILGSVRVPIGTTDYASFLLQAQASGADVIAFALSGADLVNVVKQAGEFGITQSGQKLAALIATEANIHALGPDAANGIRFSTPFYWDMDDDTRAFAARFEERMKRPPTMMQAGTYSAVNHYLKAVAAAGTDDTTAVMAKMRELPVEDFMTGGAVLRADGRVTRDVHLFQAKTAEESTGSWDMYKLLSTTPGDVATRPLSDECPHL